MQAPIPANEKATFALKIGNAIIHRINYPKTLAGKVTRTASLNARTRPLLSHTEEQDARQTCALALARCGALERGKMTFPDWKIVFREVRRELRIDRNSKRGQCDTANPIDLMSEAEADFLTAKLRAPYSQARRVAIARKMRYIRALVFTSFSLDEKRPRIATFKKQLGVCRFLCSLYSGTSRGFSEIMGDAEGESSMRSTIKRFRDYIATAEEYLTAQALQGVKARKIEFKSFADLAAVCD